MPQIGARNLDSISKQVGERHHPDTTKVMSVLAEKTEVQAGQEIRLRNGSGTLSSRVRRTPGGSRLNSSMNLAQLLTVEQILPEMTSTEHLPAIQELVDYLDSKDLLKDVNKTDVLEQLYRREEQTSTGIGSGVAIPHTFVDDLPEVVAVFGRSAAGIDFGALDNAPVHFVVLFIVPQAQYHLHLKTLAAIAKMFSGTQIRDQLTDADSAEKLLEILAKRPARG